MYTDIEVQYCPNENIRLTDGVRNALGKGLEKDRVGDFCALNPDLY
jgi:hypothetical protein